MRKCTNCGHDNFEEYNYCEKCGFKLEERILFPSQPAEVQNSYNTPLIQEKKPELYFDDKCSIAAFVLSLISIPFFIAVPFPVIAIILAAKGAKSSKFKYSAIALGISICTLLCGLLIYILIFSSWNNIVYSSFFEEIIKSLY